MFKSIQWKIVTMFVLMLLSVITVIGSFLVINISSFYNNEFTVMMNQVFTPDFISELEKETANSANDFTTLSDRLRLYTGQLGIDKYRFYCVLDARAGAVLFSSDELKSENLEKSDNIITALTGNVGSGLNSEKKYMDFAVPVKVNNASKYIVYVKDTKEEIQSITQTIFLIILQALALAILIAIVIGYLLSRTITIPIINLTKRAEKLASGEFENIAVSTSNDEIGRLTNTFRFMSSTLHDTLDEVQSEKTKIETILQNMTDGILAFNFNGKLIHINPEAKRILNLEDVQTLEFDEFFKSINANIKIGDLIYIKQAEPIERLIELNSNQYVRLNFATTNVENKIDGIVVVIHDITSQQKLELARREFVANVSHELRTPLTTIKSYAETLIDSSSDENSMETKFLTVIETEANRMTRIVKDLLTLSHLDNTTNDKYAQDCIDIKSFIESIVSKMQINASNKQQTLVYTPINEVPILKTNKDRLEQVVINIISNAIKYTPEYGHIEIFTSRVYNDAIITVIDNGIGIPSENLPRIFERFYRVDSARSRDTGGTGLGLAIAKQIIESFGGKINIKSDLGKGVEVIISLPL